MDGIFPLLLALVQHTALVFGDKGLVCILIVGHVEDHGRQDTIALVPVPLSTHTMLLISGHAFVFRTFPYDASTHRGTV